MKRSILFLIFFSLALGGFTQDFFTGDFNPRKKYVLLCNPTVSRIKTIQYLSSANLLNVNRKIQFVGVYYEGEKHDYTASLKYIAANKLKNFFLHEFKGELNETNVYQNNDLSEQFEWVFNNSIGVFFFGGWDIPPAIYGEENTRSEVHTPNRHFFEASFLFHLLGGSQNNNFKPLLAERPNYFVTGFCLGMQTMNVATGGTLIQDIPSEIYGAETPEETVKTGRTNMHRNYWQHIEDDSLLMGINLHTIRFTTHPFFTETIGIKKNETPRVLSSHHQAAEKLGLGMEVTCLSPDGKIIEGLAHHKYPHVFAVQFHPEIPALYEDMGAKKFHPEDKPMSYHEIIGKSSVRFHEAYWNYISYLLRKAKRPKN